MAAYSLKISWTDREQSAAKNPRQRNIFGVIGLGPTELVGDAPRLSAESTRCLRGNRRGEERVERGCREPLGDLTSPPELVDFRQRLRPEQPGSYEVLVRERPEPLRGQAGLDSCAAVDDKHALRRPSRDRLTARTTSGIGSPVLVLRHPDRRDGPETGTRAKRSAGSIRCCVPIRRERRRPERIHRRTVSGLQPTLRAASGTVSMLLACYNMLYERSGLFRT